MISEGLRRREKQKMYFMLPKQQFLLSRESNTSCTFSYKSGNEQSRRGNDKNTVFLKRATISICLWESIIMEIYGNLTHNIFRTTCRQLWTTKVFRNYEKREENEIGFYVISDYETNSVLSAPSAEVASSTDFWVSKNCQCKSHNNQTLRQY